MIIRSAELETVCGYTSVIPDHDLPEIAFAGKSNVGKSSLINALMNRKSLARTSSQPGKTQTINFYNVNDLLYLTDLPGYGYTRIAVSEKEKWGAMVESYLDHSTQLCAVFLLVDIRHEPSENDRNMYEWMRYYGFSPVIIATKADKLNRQQIGLQVQRIQKVLQADTQTQVIPFSKVTGEGRDQIWRMIENVIGYHEEAPALQPGKMRSPDRKPRWKDTGRTTAKKTVRQAERRAAKKAGGPSRAAGKKKKK